MPTTTASLPAVQVLQASAFTEANGQISPTAYRFMLDLIGSLSILLTAVNTAVGVNSFPFAGQPTLGAGDAGFLGFVTDYNHFVRWTGTIWTFAAGDVGNKFFRDFAGPPQELGWQLCDGSATDYLVVGAAALAVTAITPPNLSGAPAYRKSAAAYTGVPVAASAPGITGTTATEAAHTHNVPAQNNLLSAANSASLTFPQGTGANVTVADSPHTHTTTVPTQDTGGGTAHAHGVGSLAVDATAEPVHLAVLPYFRR